MVKLDLGRTLEAISLAARQDTAQSDLWIPERPVTGHCALASVLIKQYFGGTIVSGWVNAHYILGQGIWHYWNILPGGVWLDSTRSQFDSDYLYKSIRWNTAESEYWFQDTRDKYELFIRRFFEEYRKLQERIVAL